MSNNISSEPGTNTTKTIVDKPDEKSERKRVELTLPAQNSVRHRVYSTEVQDQTTMSGGQETTDQNGSIGESNDDLNFKEMIDKKTTGRVRRLSLVEILPLYVNQILPSESPEYPRISYERSYGPGYLYVLNESNQKGISSEYYKVGLSNDLKKRLRDLQNGNPRPLIPVRLIKVRNMESIEHFLATNLQPLSVGFNGGKDWYKSKDINGKNALIEIIDLVKDKVSGFEIPPEKFKEYVQYYIYFSSDH